MLKRVWKDPVWSKVIAVGIIGLISIVYAKIKSAVSDITFNDALEGIWNAKIRLGYLLILIFIILIIISLVNRDKAFYSRKQKKLRRFNRMTDPTTGILFRWGVYFHYDNSPFISDLTAFCTKHGNTPLRFLNGSCPVEGCEHSNQTINEDAIKNYIESQLLNEWEKINS